MHIFPALIDKLPRDVTYDKDALEDWDFPFIHRTIDSDSGCLEASVRMVYCAAFYCNANSSKNTVTYSLSSYRANFIFIKSRLQADEAQPALLASRKLV